MKSFAIYAAVWISAILLISSSSGQQVVISEFMAGNSKTLADQDRDYSDWVELLNAGTNTASLAGWYLTDQPDDLKKWKFPAVTVRPGEHLIVFASNKNRDTAGSELHTNFKLSSSGGYLALVQPDGLSIASAISYPTQLPNVSFGLAIERTTTSILKTGAPARILFPADAMLETTWMGAPFDDSGWEPARTPIGFDAGTILTAAQDAPLTALVERPFAHWKFSETIGTNLANSGTLGPTADAVLFGPGAVNQPGPVSPAFAGFGGTNKSLLLDGTRNYIRVGQPLLNGKRGFTMTGWIRPSSLATPRAALWGQHDVIELGFAEGRFLQLNTAGGSLTVSYPFASNQWHNVTASGDGETIRIYFDGTLAAESSAPTEGYGSSLFPFVIGGGGLLDGAGNFFRGQVDEVALFDQALSADEILLQYQAAVNPAATYNSLTPTDVASAMRGARTGAYLRIPFVTSDVSQFDLLTLKMNYDDGFVAYLNGLEVARKNAPLPVVWNSAATADRRGPIGLQSEEFNLTSALGLLHQGTNVLAIQGLNSSVSDADFLALPELAGSSLNLSSNLWRYFTPSTPGKANGFGSTNLGPLIASVEHSPRQPSATEDLLVTAKVTPALSATASVFLNYRIMYSNEVKVAMFDDGLHRDGAAGDGTFGAIIPAGQATNGLMIRYFISATDSTGNLSKWPQYLDARNSPQYLGTVVTNPSLTNPLPVLHWFLQNRTGADTSSGTRCSVFFNGEFYDNVLAGLHGQSSQSFPKKSYNFDFNTGYHFRYSDQQKPVSDFNLLTTYPDKSHMRNILAYETYRNAGSAYHVVIPLRVQQNGTFFADAHYVEDGNEEYLERLGMDPRGALYKMYDIFDSAGAGEKKTRRTENNTDLAAVIAGSKLTGNASRLFLCDNVNIPGMISYLAAMIITGGVDCCHKNYYAYRDSEGTGEWVFTPWDVDLTFGRNWTGDYFDDATYANEGLDVGNNNNLIRSLFAVPAIKQMYYRRIRTLMDTMLQAPGTATNALKYEKRVNEIYNVIAPDAALDYAKWPTWKSKQPLPVAVSNLVNGYLVARRKFMFATNGTFKPVGNPQPANVLVQFGAMDFNPASHNQAEEYLQIVNTNSFPVDISNWRIEGGIEHTFKPGTVLPTGTNGVLHLSPEVAAFRARTTAPRGGLGLFVQGNYKGQLSARGETLRILDDTGRLVQAMNYIGKPSQAQLYLRITEVMYNPVLQPGLAFPSDDFEFIALKNIGGTALDVSGVHFTNGISFRFGSPGVTSLDPGQVCYVVKNSAAFRQLYGNQPIVAGEFIGSLDNGGERLKLNDASGEVILDFTYRDDWVPDSDGKGYSLVIVNEFGSYLTWDNASSWRASDKVNGTIAIPSSDYLQWQTRNFTPADLSNPVISGDAADPDHDGFTNWEEYLSGTDPKNGQNYLKIEAITAQAGSVRVRFPAVAGKSYSLLYRDSLQPGGWIKLKDFDPIAANGIQEWVDSASSAARYYRLATPKAP